MNRVRDQKFWRIVACLTATQTGSLSLSLSLSLGIPVLKDVSASKSSRLLRGVNRDRYLRIAANKNVAKNRSKKFD
jgi:hypothetical protein